MATFFSGATVGYWSSSSNYMYGTLTGNVSRSGNTVTLSSMTLSITSRYSSTGTSPWSFTVHNSTFSGTINHPPTSISIPNTSFSVSTTQISASVGWSSSDGYSGSFSVSFPSGSTAPTGLAVSVVDKGQDYITMDTSISSYGTPSSANDRYIAAIIWSKDLAQYGGNPHIETKAYRLTSATLRVDNSSDALWGGITLFPNTLYSYGAFATNTETEARVYHQASVATLPAKLTDLSLVSQTVIGANITAEISYGVDSKDGGYHSRTGYYRYSTDNGETWSGWVSIGTISSADTFTISGLPGSSNISVQTKVSTNAGESDYATLNFTTDPSAIRIYAPVNGSAKTISKFYASVDGQAKEIKKIYGSSNGETVLIFDNSQ